jgi:hypothetical protein
MKYALRNKVKGPFEWAAMRETYVQNQRQVSHTRFATSRSLQVSDVRFYFILFYFILFYFIFKYLNIQYVLLQTKKTIFSMVFGDD